MSSRPPRREDENPVRTAAQFHLLHEIGLAINSASAIEEITDAVVDGLAEKLGYSLVSIYFLRDGVLRLAGLRGYERYLTEIELGMGVNGRVAASGTAALVPAVREDPDYVSVDDAVCSEACAPIRVPGETIGVVNVESKEARLDETDLRLLQMIADQVGLAVHRLRLYERQREMTRQYERTSQQLTYILQIGRQIHSQTTEAAVLQAIVDTVHKGLGFGRAVFSVVDDSGQWLRRAAVASSPYRLSECAASDGRISTTKLEELTRPDFQTGACYLIPSWYGRRFLSESAEGWDQDEDDSRWTRYNCLLVPVRSPQGGLIGYLSVDDPPDQQIPGEDVLRVLEIFAAQAGVAIENVRLFEGQRLRAGELETILAISRQLDRLTDTDEIGTTVVTELGRLISYHACRMWVVDRDGDRLRPAACGYDSALYPDDKETLAQLNVRVGPGNGLVGAVAASGVGEIVNSVLTDERAATIPGTEDIEESMVLAPVVHTDRVLGVITLSKVGRDQFGGEDLRLLSIIAALAAQSIENSRLFERMRHMAMTDDLTGLYNRRHLMEHHRHEVARARRYRQPLSAILLDVDRFKQINDTHGHEQGDRVLRDLATVLRELVRTGDIVARSGGEEFVVLLPQASIEEAALTAERIRQGVERHPFQRRGGRMRVTVSVGYAQYDASLALDLFAAADQAMYAAKQAGGNCVSGYREPAAMRAYSRR